MVAALRRAGRIIARQIVKRGRNPRRVQVIPKRRALAPQLRGRRSMVDRPEIELHLVFAHFPETLAGHRLRGGIEGRALLLGMTMDEIENPVRAGTGAVVSRRLRRTAIRTRRRGPAAGRPNYRRVPRTAALGRSGCAPGIRRSLPAAVGRACRRAGTHRCRVGRRARPGVAAGAVCLFFSAAVKRLLGYDDSLDVFGIHCIGGILGAIATGLLVSPEYGGTGILDYAAKPGTAVVAEYVRDVQLMAQVKAVALTLVWSGIGTAISLKVVDLLIGTRVSPDVETQGLDLAEHGERAYNM